MPALEPAGPILTATLFEPLGAELLRLLGSLERSDWGRPTIAPAWTVHDVAAHLLDTAWRRLSSERDRHVLPPPSRTIASYGDLVAFLNEVNAQWVETWRRVSPPLLVEALASAERALAAHLPTVDPFGQAPFSVAWAGESESRVWFDVARELTERWHHQQQIRLAVGAPPLDDPRYSRPVLETFLRAWPPRLARVAAPHGGGVGIEIEGRETYRFALRREAAGWSLWRGTPDDPAATIAWSEETAWRMFTKSLPADEARRRSRLSGDESLLAPLFGVLAIMG